jgi:hypothetical protein
MPDDNVFPIGDHTIMQMRNQVFALDDAGTIVASRATLGIPTAVESEPAADPIARLEQKVDTALRALEAIQRRLDSFDATLARVLAK